MPDTIYHTSANKTIRFAADELAAYIRRITGRRCKIERVATAPPRAAGFLIECDDVSGRNAGTDRFEIKPQGRLIILGGSRPRCCLYAVYSYLEANGVRFLRPGPDGEIVPKRARLKRNVRMRQTASYDHRNICHEGATAIEHVLGMVDWMAKRRLNEFHLQFETSMPFWNRWYDHELNPQLQTDPITAKRVRRKKLSFEQSRRLDNIVIRHLKLRDLDVHRMGHGWTCLSLGVSAEGWTKTDVPVPRGMRNRLAKVNGKREWWKGIPGNTQLCFSNKQAFDALVQTVVDYCAQHTEADVALFCLADGMNQHCECARCRKLSVTDWYAKLVNAIGRSLVEHGLKTIVSFDAYVDVLWPPEKHPVQVDTGNLLFMYAPFFRCYEHALADPTCLDDFPVHKWPHNQTPTISGNRAYTQLLRMWQSQCATDSYLADYHFIRLHYYALDEWLVAKRVHQDVADLMKLGINGLFSCQVMRAFYPSALCMNVMAQTQWDRTADFDEVCDDYLHAAFGRSGSTIKDYFQQVHGALKPATGEHNHLMYVAQDVRGARRAVKLLEQWAPQLEQMRRRATHAVHKRSFDYVIHYNALLQPFCRAATCIAKGDADGAKQQIAQATDFVCSTEQDTHWALDTWNVNLWAEERILRWQRGPKWFEEQEQH